MLVKTRLLLLLLLLLPLLLLRLHAHLVARRPVRHVLRPRWQRLQQLEERVLQQHPAQARFARGERVPTIHLTKSGSS